MSSRGSRSFAGDVEGGGLRLDEGFEFGVVGEGGVFGDEFFGELAGEVDEVGVGEEVAEAEAGEAGLGGAEEFAGAAAAGGRPRR